MQDAIATPRDDRVVHTPRFVMSSRRQSTNVVWARLSEASATHSVRAYAPSATREPEPSRPSQVNAGTLPVNDPLRIVALDLPRMRFVGDRRDRLG